MINTMSMIQTITYHKYLVCRCNRKKIAIQQPMQLKNPAVTMFQPNWMKKTYFHQSTKNFEMNNGAKNNINFLSINFN